MRLVRFFDNDGNVDVAINQYDIVAVYRGDVGSDYEGRTLVDVRNGDTFILHESIDADEAASDIENR